MRHPHKPETHQAPLAGALCSRYGRAAATRFGVLGLSGATLAFGLVPAAVGPGSPGWMLAGAFSLLRGAQGVFSAFVQTALLAAIAGSFEENSGPCGPNTTALSGCLQCALCTPSNSHTHRGCDLREVKV